MVQKGYNTEIINNYIDGADEVDLVADMNAIDDLIPAGADNELIVYVQHPAK